MGAGDSRSSNSSPSGEHFVLLIAAIKELRDDHRDFRVRVEAKLDEAAESDKAILIRLAEGTGRMDTMESKLTAVSETVTDSAERIRSLERGSGIRPAVSTPAPAPEADKGTGGWISVDRIVPILTAVGALLALLLGAAAYLRDPTKVPPPAAPSVSQPAP